MATVKAAEAELVGVRRRLSWVAMLLLVVLVGLLVRAAALQLVWGSYYRELADHNRVRTVPLPSLRGRLYDRYGRLLAGNVPTFTLVMVPEDVEEQETVLRRVGQLLDMPGPDLRRLLAATPVASQRFLPVVLREGLTLAETARIEAHRYDLPGIAVDIGARREYPYGSLAAHVLGYLGETAPPLARGRVERLYPGTMVGQVGIEAAYDARLRGATGYKGIEVDAFGHERRVLAIEEPVAGDDLFLTLDLHLQQAAEDALGGQAGVVVAMDPWTGEILAMASHPSFDPNLLSWRLRREEWARLAGDDRAPLLNRAIQGLYPPGSVFKIVVGAAAMESASIPPAHQVRCRGAYPYRGRVFRDWKKGGHGSMDLHRAIVESCDVFFYDLGVRMGIDRLADYASRFGLGQPSGIDIAFEKAGLVPSSDWKLGARGEVWYPGETLPVAIGQGYLSVTPLQLATMISVVATGGHIPRPHLGRAVRSAETGEVEELQTPAASSRRAALAPQTLAMLQQALRDVVADPQGTGHRARSPIVEIAGKTGTAQVITARPLQQSEQIPREHRDHAWFVAYAPVEDPRLVVVILVEHAGAGGGKVAAPLAKRVFEAYFSHGT